MSALDGKALLEHGETIARRYAHRIGTEVAEELRAEAVLRALRSPAPDGRIEPWLERIYRNLLIDYWRRGPSATSPTAELDAIPAPHASPEDAVLLRERRRLLRASLRRLPPDARRVLLARYYVELDEASTARRLGIAGATVRTRVHRALQRLRTWLGDLCGFSPPLFARWSGQLAAAGAAPVVAALLVLGQAVPAPPQLVIATEVVPALPSAHVYLRTAGPSPTRASATGTPPARTAKRPAVAAPVAIEVPAPAPAAGVVRDIQWPEPLDVFAEPEKPAPPCLVEPPAAFAVQIEKMVEDAL